MDMVNLEKKDFLNLNKVAPDLHVVCLGIRWDKTDFNSALPDVDASVFMLNMDMKMPSSDFIVFYNNLVSPEGAVEHCGANHSGIGDGEDAMIEVNLSKVDHRITQILLYLTIHNTDAGFHFGNLSNTSIRAYHGAAVLFEFRVADSFPHSDILLMGQFLRHPARLDKLGLGSAYSWQFQAMGDASSGGLGALAEQYS